MSKKYKEEDIHTAYAKGQQDGLYATFKTFEEFFSLCGLGDDDNVPVGKIMDMLSVIHNNRYDAHSPVLTEERMEAILAALKNMQHVAPSTDDNVIPFSTKVH